MNVTVSADDLTPDNYARSGCDTALKSSPRRWNSDYGMALHQHLEEMQRIGDDKAAAICRVLLAIAMRTPWNTLPGLSEDSGLINWILDDSGFAYLRAVLPQIVDAEMRGRAADLLYQRSIGKGKKRDIAAAEIAVRSYLIEVARHEQPNRYWRDAEQRLVRALDIALELNHKILRQEVLVHIEQVLTAYEPPARSKHVQETNCPIQDGNDARLTFYPAKLMTLLLHTDAGEPTHYALLSESLASEAMVTDAWDLHRDYLLIAAQWHERAGHARSELCARECAAESWVTQAVKMTARPNAHSVLFLMAQDPLRDAIQSLKEVMSRATNLGLTDDAKRIKDRIETVRLLHLEYGERGMQAFVTYSGSVTIEKAPLIELVEGKTKWQALFTLATLSMPTRASIESAIRDEQETDPLRSLFSLVQLEERGRTSARSEHGADDCELWAHICKQAVMEYELYAKFQSILRWKINTDHVFDINDFQSIVRDSGFASLSRAPLLARGLYMGMQGSIDTAIHILIPQIEHAIREIVREIARSDEQLRTTHTEMLSDPARPSLGESLREPWATNIAQMWGAGGEDIVFAFRVLLIERFGGNLRNRIFHGLTDYGGVQDLQCWYMWWLVLKVCCFTARVDEGEFS